MVKKQKINPATIVVILVAIVGVFLVFSGQFKTAEEKQITELQKVDELTGTDSKIVATYYDAEGNVIATSGLMSAYQLTAEELNLGKIANIPEGAASMKLTITIANTGNEPIDINYGGARLRAVY